MAKVKRVGRPNGKSKKTSDAERIRKVLLRFGVLCPVKKVKSILKGYNAIANFRNRVKFNTALDVKIAQVRSELIEELTGLKRENRGRMTTEERETIELALATVESKLRSKRLTVAA